MNNMDLANSSTSPLEEKANSLRLPILITVGLVAVIVAYNFFSRLAEEQRQETAWSAMKDFEAGKIEADQADKIVSGSSAESWFLLQAASTAIRKDEIAKAKAYLDRLEKLKNSPLQLAPSAGLEEAKGKNPTAAMRAKLEKFQEWKAQHPLFFKNPDPAAKPRVTFVTDEGDFVIGLYPDKAPKAVENFIRSCKSDAYKGTRFFDILEDVSFKAGEGTTRSENPAEWVLDNPNGKTFACEETPLAHFKGAISMSRKDANSECSETQFTIYIQPQLQLDESYPVFGQVVDGIAVIEKIGKIKSDYKEGKSIPSKLVMIKEVRVEE